MNDIKLIKGEYGLSRMNFLFSLTYSQVVKTIKISFMTFILSYIYFMVINFNSFYDIQTHLASVILALLISIIAIYYIVIIYYEKMIERIRLNIKTISEINSFTELKELKEKYDEKYINGDYTEKEYRVMISEINKREHSLLIETIYH